LRRRKPLRSPRWHAGPAEDSSLRFEQSLQTSYEAFPRDELDHFVRISEPLAKKVRNERALRTCPQRGRRLPLDRLDIHVPLGRVGRIARVRVFDRSAPNTSGAAPRD
jgi:hypothetical protein